MKRLSYLTILCFLVPSLGCSPHFAPTPTETPFSPEPTATLLSSSLQPETIASVTTPLSIHRGVNFGHTLEVPDEDERILTIREECFDLVQDAGFDFVRLPVAWKVQAKRTGHDDGDTGYTIEPAFFARVDEIVAWALRRDLAVILDFHNYEVLSTDPNGEQFWFLWRQIAEHYRDWPPQVFFELANEPHGKMTAPLWNLYVHIALQVIRESNPTRNVIVGPVNWNSYFWVTTLDVPNDPNIIVAFHYSDPFYSTYRRTDGQAWFGDIWPNNEERKREITRDFDVVADWAERHDGRVLLGEFGVYNASDMDSLVRWTEFVRSEAERHGFAWAYWEFASDHGVFDTDTKKWREGILKALIP